MKRFFMVALLGLFLAGCGAAAKESEFWQHDTMYKDWSHLSYSWSGYKQPTKETGQQSKAEKWWGIPEPGPSEK